MSLLALFSEVLAWAPLVALLPVVVQVPPPVPHLLFEWFLSVVLIWSVSLLVPASLLKVESPVVGLVPPTESPRMVSSLICTTSVILRRIPSRSDPPSPP